MRRVALFIAAVGELRGRLSGALRHGRNVQEWIDHCESTEAGAQNDSCFLSGSSFGSGDPSCPAYGGLPRDALYADLGFRCCSP